MLVKALATAAVSVAMKKFELQNLLRDQSAVSVTEFGLIAPAVVTMLLGTMDVGHTLYMRTVIDGAIQEVARDSALEDGGILAKQEAIDALVALIEDFFEEGE